MKPRSIELNPDEIQNYDLENEHFTDEEKFLAESWYQFPGDVTFLYALAALSYSLFRPVDWIMLLLGAFALSLMVGIVNWLTYLEKTIFIFYAVILGGKVLMILPFLLAGYAAWLGFYAQEKRGQSPISVGHYYSDRSPRSVKISFSVLWM